MRLSINLLYDSISKNKEGLCLILLSTGLFVGSFYLFPIHWIAIATGALALLLVLLLPRVYWIIGVVFFLLFGPIGTLHIGGKTPNLFYEDFYLAILLFLSLIVGLQKGKTKVILSNYAPYILLFLGVGFLSLFNTPDTLRGLGFLKVFITGFLVFFLCVNMINRESDVRKVVYSLPLFGCILAAWLCWNVFTASSLAKANVYISWGHSNYLATFFLFLIPMTIGLFFSKGNGRFTKFYLLASIIIMAIGLVTTESRGAIIAFGIALLVFCIAVCREKLFRYFVPIIITFIAIVALHPATGMIFNKMRYAFSYSILGARMTIYEGAVKAFLAHPIIGGGLGSLQHYMEQFMGRSSYMAHNVYLHFLAETGFVGLVSLLTLFIISYKNIRNLIKLSSKDSYTHYWAIGVLAGFIGLLAHSFVESSFQGYQFFILYWVVMGLVYMELKFFRSEKWAKTRSPS